ncbi:MAG: hypothetical protein QM529_05105 [Hydrotalea sp.]|nr:hypothetical protein [Hydrotalea sp.]
MVTANVALAQNTVKKKQVNVAPPATFITPVLLPQNQAVDRFVIKGDVGYVYGLSGSWSKTNDLNLNQEGSNSSLATGGIGYGGSLGWTSDTGFGLSADYMGFNRKWTGAGTGSSASTNYNYDANYHVVALVPSYRFSLDSDNHWGLRFGVGLGATISNIKWAQQASTSGGSASSGAKQNNGVRVAAGADYTDVVGNAGPCGSAGIYSDGRGSIATPSFANGVHITLGRFQCIKSTFNPDGSVTNEILDSGLTADDFVRLLAVGQGKFLLNARGTIIAGGQPVDYNVWSQVIQSGNEVSIDSLQVLADAFNGTPNGAGYEVNFETVPQGSTVIIADDTWNKITRQGQVALTAAGAQSASQAQAACIAAGGTWANNVCTPAQVITQPPVIPLIQPQTTSSSGGLATGGIGFIVVPQVSLDIDYDWFHMDVSVKYLHQVLNTRYAGHDNSGDAVTYISKPGPLAVFFGGGLGFNF